MSLKRYMKKPAIVHAFRWDGETIPDEVADCYYMIEYLQVGDDGLLRVKTPSGTAIARPGDYVCFGEFGDVWPVRGDIFERIYDQVD